MPNTSCSARTMAAIEMAVLRVVFSTLSKAVKTSQDTIKAAMIRIRLSDISLVC